MTARELIRSASIEILAHKARSTLTCLSLAVGVAAMLYTFSQTAFMRRWLQASIDMMGPGRMSINPKSDHISRGLSPGLTSQDADAIRNAFPALYMVYPQVERWGMRMRSGNFHSKEMLVLATTPEWRKRDWAFTLHGRFFNDDDLRTAARVCVLVQPGGWVKKPYWAQTFLIEQDLDKALQHMNLLGKRMLIEDHLFTVIGIIRAPPRDLDPRWFNNEEWDWPDGGVALVPLTSYQRYLSNAGPKGNPYLVDFIAVDTGNEADIGIYQRRLEGLMNTLHRREQDFEVKDFRQDVQGAIKESRQAAAAVLVIGIVAILAGGIGIMNVTLATVFSRIREIGIRRSLGAAQSDIVLQFVTEAMLLGFLGAAFGVPMGFAADYYLAPDPTKIAWPEPGHLVAAVAISVGAGLVFSIFPAWRASKFDPIEALRYE